MAKEKTSVLGSLEATGYKAKHTYTDGTTSVTSSLNLSSDKKISHINGSVTVDNKQIGSFSGYNRGDDGLRFSYDNFAFEDESALSAAVKAAYAAVLADLESAATA